MKKTILAVVSMMAANSGYSQICNPSITPSTTIDRYTIVNQGTEIQDKKTGLQWQRCSMGQTWSVNTCTGEAGTYTWQEGLDLAKKTVSNWRVPTIEELKTLQEVACYGAAINETIFPATPLNNETWSSSAESAEYGMMMSFYNGDVSSNDKLNPLYLRFVKSIVTP